ncbi:MAG: O-succinylbenzoic acid--CoA ligase, partial [Candidatus Marinimicrobia bacterium]|nr:O-succinylbenzoic acid--CoA ligase [Candidatus Neomarinimicrobiota bacterium]MBT4308158.1 O-succinylbenzoic acid--CoA ligase [Candidatus Neomarinimicrobiota bacterium]MBT4735887.1 O-succinylbenzoic acid--CoA ligase [Candidatus Neomarinimicrobiota bacterium]MBT5386627.1 O-succinylbenzoic acid--CoA ligase [Candidatus Neomarinimicrobiota bacterium]
NSGGIKIIPEVVEAKLTAVISDRRFFIAGVPDESLGKKVILIIEGERLDISLDSLEKYEKPKEIHFIEKFRVTTSGKIYRNNILDMLRE